MSTEANLAWFPKRFGPGDMHGSGEKKVLGRPEIDFLQLLVRETAQNSWDARVAGVVPHFELRLRGLDKNAMEVLRGNVFAERQVGSPLDASLAADSATILEIADRGTKGLGGPTQNSVPAAPGQPNDYADFILTVGAPPEDLTGGGSYGFGKTACYLASRCSTIVVWSRFMTSDGTIGERFVASAMGSVFELDGQLFTGRQWWGVRSPEAPLDVLAFEPIEGAEAGRLGRALFERHFGTHETGTSILVLDFAPLSVDNEDEENEAEPSGAGDVEPRELARRVADAVVRNLWPKLSEDQPQEWRMNALVALNGETLPLVTDDDSPVLKGFRRCLHALRAVQSGSTNPDQEVQLRPTRWYSHVTGHVAFTRVINDFDQDALATLGDRVALMRHHAELVVRSEPYLGGSSEAFRWVGVFKPVAAFDGAFAAAEPPAHDSWSNVQGLDKRTKSIVNRTLRSVRDEARSFLTPIELGVAGADRSTGALAAALAGLAGGLVGSGASSSTNRPRGGVGSRTRTKILVRDVKPLPRDGDDLRTGRQRTQVRMAQYGTTPSLVRAESLSVAIEGGTMEAGGEVRLDRWVGGEPAEGGVLASPGEEISAILSYPEGVAISFSFQAGPA